MRACLLTTTFFFLYFYAYTQNTLDKAGLTAANPASAAYSVRLLSSNYTGKALQVRRSSDNTTQDIGFTASGDLDNSALLTFVGAGNGFVSIWYDQSGNGQNLKQTTTTNQPKIVSAGVVNTQNSVPFIQFWGIPYGSPYNALDLVSGGISTVGHLSAVMQMPSGSDGFILSHSGAYYWSSSPPNYLISSTYASSSVQGGGGWSNGTSYTPALVPWPTSLSVDEFEPSAPSTGTGWTNIGTDRQTVHNMSAGGGFSELILFATALPTAARQSLETNEGTYYSIAITLPVTWLDFTALLQGSAVDLQWQTATEQNSGKFVVERSSDGNNWTNLGSVAAAGNSVMERTYSYADDDPMKGANYYRLVQTDLDGAHRYSKVCFVEVGNTGTPFSVAPNPPVTGSLQVKVNRSILLSLYTMAGRLLWQRQCAPGLQVIDISAYSKGVYLLSGAGTTVQVVKANN